MAQPSRPWCGVALRLVSPALIVVFAAGCGGADQPATVHPATRPAAVTPTSRPAWTLVSSANRAKFLAALRGIDRHLTADREGALAHAVDVCYQIYDGKPDTAVRDFARQAYTTGDTKISKATARTIVTKVKKWICSNGVLYRRWES